jgi:2-polyprenyl-3-methyl-5-hydroxy-6-metoxy-1,4-benzoquinol methylase
MTRALTRLLAAGLLLAAAPGVWAEEGSRDDTAARFNRLYTEFDQVFSHEPNAFLVEAVRGVHPGTALDVAMGQGRNTLFLARKGWDVTGFDIAEEGLKIARAEAQKQGLRIKAVCQGWEDFDFGRERWDLVVLSYAWVPLADPDFVARIRDSLRPGGLVLIEHPVEEPEDAGKDPGNAAASAVNALPRAYSDGLQVLFYQDTQDISDWQRTPEDRMTTKGRIVRLLARRMPSSPPPTTNAP